MQGLTAPPREVLTVAQVRALLLSEALQVSAGAELLSANLMPVRDLSDDLLGGAIDWNLRANIHGTCDLTLSAALTWGVDLVRPYMTLSDAAVTARFNLGVYALTTPERTVGADPVIYAVQGFNRIYLLDREVGADLVLVAGTTYRAALLDVFGQAGLSGVSIDGSAADSTLPATRTWPLVATSTDPDQTKAPVTWLRVVNDLLSAINFRGVWADENGQFRCSAYKAPAQRPSEFEFDADSGLTIVGAARTVVEDVWRTPNRWVFRQTNRAVGAPAPTEGDGIYTVVNQSDGATSIDARGLTWTSVVDYEAATHATLVSLGDRRVASDRRVTQQLKVTTGPLPVAGHADVFTYRDLALGADRKVQAVSWRMDLLGADMSWVWEVI